MAAGFVGAQYIAQTTITIPDSIKQRAGSTIYLPTSLPGAYKVVEESFNFEETTLIFYATDGAGGKLVFTEQPKPKEIDFEQFYQENFVDTKILGDVSYSSTWGKTRDGKRLVLGIVTDDTWLLMTTNAPLGESDMLRIAKSLSRV